MRKRDYDGAIAAFSAALEADPENVGYINLRGIAYSNKGDDEHALADYETCLKLRPNFASAYNNRGLIFMRRGDSIVRSRNSTSPSSITQQPDPLYHLYNRGRVQTLPKAI